jgi:hypothetical protein
VSSAASTKAVTVLTTQPLYIYWGVIKEVGLHRRASLYNHMAKFRITKDMLKDRGSRVLLSKDATDRQLKNQEVIRL